MRKQEPRRKVSLSISKTWLDYLLWKQFSQSSSVESLVIGNLLQNQQHEENAKMQSEIGSKRKKVMHKHTTTSVGSSIFRFRILFFGLNRKATNSSIKLIQT